VIYVSKRGPIALLAGVLAVALILVGCGGGSGSDSTAPSSDATTSDSSTASLSKAEFIKKADAVCAAGGKRTQSEYAAYVEEKKLSAKKEPTPAQFAEISEEIQVPAFKRQVEEIRAVGAPPGEEDQITALVDALDAGIEKVEEADPKKALESSSSMFVEADKLAVAYGLKVCGHSEG
jgi:hypothetical protein